MSYYNSNPRAMTAESSIFTNMTALRVKTVSNWDIDICELLGYIILLNNFIASAVGTGQLVAQLLNFKNLLVKRSIGKT